ncbi:TlyA family RNA methyltransferase [Georgenia sp. TF02-10]|uniref:TlyA family RNA methyltransferase n=1 Tax=Georgenia sp. TF02-10 TaxID=2917725 RepID=UPI001FA6D792|nr:TlyA family RNA methyltransferase [Georgenia sp. TF02-10]UNX56034.1 TlyA family RNA methyltransferase [Georgenia sp. TF02-10]
MARRLRVDTELVRRGLARSRQHAAELLDGGQVRLDGAVVTKPARQVNPAQALVVDTTADAGYVSRGAHKLAGALDALGPRAPVVAGRRALDAGASTGGFTDVLLRRGAAHVLAVDVGYGQLAWALRTDPRVRVLDRTNVRDLTRELVGPPPDLVVGDLSFISLTVVLPALAGVAAPDADLLLMVKPQFEVGKDRLGKGGVVRDPALHAEAVLAVAGAAAEQGLDTWAVVPSPLPGPAGNVEYFLALRRDHPAALAGPDLVAAAAEAVRTGPAGSAGAVAADGVPAVPADGAPAGPADGATGGIPAAPATGAPAAPAPISPTSAREPR